MRLYCALIISPKLCLYSFINFVILNDSGKAHLGLFHVVDMYVCLFSSNTGLSLAHMDVCGPKVFPCVHSSIVLYSTEDEAMCVIVCIFVLP